jgi:hypothetical protein
MASQKDLQLISNLMNGFYPSLDITIMELKEIVHIFINTPYSVIYNPMDFTPMIKFLGTDISLKDTFELYHNLDSFLPHISDKIIIVGVTTTGGDYMDDNHDRFIKKVFDRDYGAINYTPNVC